MKLFLVEGNNYKISSSIWRRVTISCVISTIVMKWQHCACYKPLCIPAPNRQYFVTFTFPYKKKFLSDVYTCDKKLNFSFVVQLHTRFVKNYFVRWARHQLLIDRPCEKFLAWYDVHSFLMPYLSYAWIRVHWPLHHSVLSGWLQPYKIWVMIITVKETWLVNHFQGVQKEIQVISY